VPRQAPHWAIRLLLDPHEDIPELVAGVDYPDRAVWDQALEMFVPSLPGWVPTWFPTELHHHRWTRQETVESLSPQQRLEWFDKALAHYAWTEWPPVGSLISKKRVIAQSLLRMWCAAESEEIPTPDKM